MEDQPTNTDIEKQPEFAWVPAFLAALSTSPNVSKAAKLAGVNRQYVYEVRERNAAFKAAWDDAIETAVDELEDRAYELAKTGETPVLTIFLLKGRRREIYGDQLRADVNSQVNVSGSVTLYIPTNGRESEGGSDGS